MTEPQAEGRSYPGAGHPIAESLAAASALGTPLVFLCPRKSQSFASAFAELEWRLQQTKDNIYLLIDAPPGGALLADFAAAGIQTLQLFPGDSDPALLEVAPVLVPCSDAQMVLERFHSFWARGFASILTSRADPQTLHLHLRKTLYVEVPGGELCILRFHDPRVLNRIAEVLMEDQIDEVFQDAIESFIFENAGGDVQTLTRPQVVAE